jgi:pimeloyl-ACP methyl ester carboxylesterase
MLRRMCRSILGYRWVRRAPLLAGGLVGLWLLLSLIAADQLTRRARLPFAEPAPQVAWGPVESLRLATADGEQLGAWYAPGGERGPSVVLLHGNGNSRAWCLPWGELLAAEGCSVLLVTLRAHGDSTGERNDIGYSARHDVAAAVEYLERRRPGKPVLLMGKSLGAAAAVFAARDLGERVRGCLLESPYRDLRTAVRNRVENHLPPVLDRIAYAGLVFTGRLVLPYLDRIAPAECAGAIPPDVPVWVLAGAEDDQARPEEARALYERVAGHGRLVFFAGAGHESLLPHDPARYRRVVKEWLRAATGEVRGTSGEGAGGVASSRPGVF